MKLIRSIGFALSGIRAAFREETNLRTQVLVTAVVIVAGIYVDLGWLEWTMIILCCGVVMSAELINTAIENLTDLISESEHPLAGKVKDLSAGAVLVVAIASVIVGLIIFGRHVSFNVF